MGSKYRHALAIVLCILLAGCNAPRGAAFEDEILAASSAAPATKDAPAPDAAALPGFAIYPVTRESLPGLSGWPVIGAQAYSWLSHREQPATTIIGPGDILNIKVWDTADKSLLVNNGPGERNADLSGVVVGPDGVIFLPFVGEMQVNGLSPSVARAKIQERFITSIPSAQVQVSVAQGRPNTANLVSGVLKPGIYPLPDQNFTLLSLLSLGGGIQPTLKNPQVRLMRANSVYRIAVSQLYGDPMLDTTLRGGDQVIVEEDDRYFLSLGATGIQALQKFTQQSISALDAMAIVGGVDELRANPQGIMILREYPRAAVRTNGSGPSQERVIFTLDLTSADGLFSAGKFQVMSGDLVYATESPVTSTRSVLALAAVLVGLGNSF